MILIIGTGRSGTSAIAKVVWDLGIHFCDHLIEAHPSHNPLGHYECREWWNLGEQDKPDYERLIESHMGGQDWAIKDTWLRPSLACVIHQFKVIAAHRQFNACVKSRMLHSGMDQSEATAYQMELESRLYYLCKLTDALHIDYEELIAYPHETVARIAGFIGVSGKATVYPELNHHSILL